MPRLIGVIGSAALVVILLAQGVAVAKPAEGATSGPDTPRQPASVARIVLSPARASTVVHHGMTYAVQAYDKAGHPLGDVTDNARFSISPDGSCSGNHCTADNAGVHRVTAEIEKGAQVITDTAVLDVMPLPEPPKPPGGTALNQGSPTKNSALAKANKPGAPATTKPLGDSPSSAQRQSASPPQSQPRQAPQASDAKRASPSGPRLVLTPARKFVVPGERTAYVVTAFDGSGSSLGVVTSRAKVSITFSANGHSTARPEGSCSAAVCVAAKLGRHTVSAVVVIGGTVVKASADLQVVPKHHRPRPVPQLASIEIRPSEAAIESGEVIEYVADGFDRNHRPIGDVTSFTVFTIDPEGTCIDNRCTATEPGTHTVTGTVRATKFPITDTAKLLVTPRIAGLRIEPGSATVEVGESVSYTAYGVDSADRIVAVLTDVTSFSMDAPGGCRDRTCTPTEAGVHTVTGRATVGDRVLIDTARLRAIPAVVALELRPDEAVTRVGRGVTFTAHGLDAQGRSVVDLTDETEFTMPPGRCVRSTCEASRTGDYTVTGVATLRNRRLSDTAVLHVTSGITGLILDPSSRTITAGGSVSYIAWGLDDERRPAFDLTAVTRFSIDEPGSCTDATCTATSAKGYTVTGTVTVEEGTFGATATLDVVPGPIDRLDLVPQTARVVAGTSARFRAFASDVFGNRIGEVTRVATFSMPKPGSCTESECMSTQAGEHTVTASVVVGRRVEGTAILVVTPGPLARLVLDPARTRVAAGTDVTFRAFGSDVYGNPIDEVTRSTKFRIDLPGTCTESTCSATKAQTYEVTGEALVDGRTLTGTAVLDVLPGPIDTLALSPSRVSAKAGEGATFRAQGRDAYGNDIGDVTSQTTFTITDDGTCTVDGTCSGKLARSYTVTGRVPSDTRTVTGTAVLDVVAGPAKGLVLDPPYALAMSGAGVTYHAYSADEFGNRLDDVTTSTKFTISPDGSCPDATCSTTGLGPHKVTGIADLGAGRVTATADVLVLSVEIGSLRLNPYEATIVPDEAATFDAVGLDRDDNAVSNLTDLTTFSVTGDGSCPLGRNVCSASTPGEYRITGTVPISIRTATGTVTRPVTGHATLKVGTKELLQDGRGGVASIVLSPQDARAYAGFGVTYTATGLDAAGKKLHDVTAETRFTISPDDVECVRSYCVSNTPGPHTVTGTYQGVTGVAQGGTAGPTGSGPTAGPTIGPGGGTAASRSGTSDGRSVSRSLPLRTAPQAEPIPVIKATASLTVERGPLACFAIASADAQSFDAIPTPGSGTTSVSVTGTFPMKFVTCKVRMVVEDNLVVAGTPIRSDGSIAWTATVSSDPGPRSVKVAVTTVLGLPLSSKAFTIPPPSGSNWPLWLVLGILVLAAVGTVATTERDKRQRRWAAQHINVQPIPADGDVSTGQDDPATKSHTVHLVPHTEKGSITITEEGDQ